MGLPALKIQDICATFTRVLLSWSCESRLHCLCLSHQINFRIKCCGITRLNITSRQSVHYQISHLPFGNSRGPDINSHRSSIFVSEFPSRGNTSEIRRQHKASGEQGNKEHFTLAKFGLVGCENLYQMAREHFNLAKFCFVGYIRT